eukprot:TRINITY_DN11868_c0_g1_i1.p1 TRINITY_DN11868_c0_g1~~TRINITY_DN11868_c0_g1_i1.p1  ORF type:complete len:1011 (+),score=337.44 TRINITY_DN11868_c0_g1_i1:207-3239(+)
MNGRVVSSEKQLTHQKKDGAELLLKAIKKGSVVETKKCLRYVDVNIVFADGQSALSFALVQQQSAIVKTLVEAGADTNLGILDKKAHTALCKTDQPDIVRLLMTHGADLTAGDACCLRRTLRARDQVLFAVFLEQGLRLESVFDSAVFPRTLFNATHVINGLHMLQDAGLALPTDGCVLHYAAGTGSLDALKLLLPTWPDINRCDASKWQWPALMWAIWHHPVDPAGAVACVRLLLESGASPDTSPTASDKPDRALPLAARPDPEAESLELVALLIEHGADVNVRDYAGRTALHCAVQRGHECVAKSLLDRGADPNLSDFERLPPLQSAVLRGHRGLVTRLLDAGAEIDAHNRFGRTALHEACSKGFIDLAELLLDRGAQLEARDPLGRTPLLDATRCKASPCFEEQIERLLRRGADPNARRADGCSVFDLDQRVIDLLARLGVTSDEPRYRFQWPMGFWHILAFPDGAGLDKFLGSLNLAKYRGFEGSSLLHLAAEEGLVKVVKILLMKGLSPALVRPKDGATPLSLAAQYNQTEIVAIMEAHLADEQPFALAEPRALVVKPQPGPVVTSKGHKGRGRHHHRHERPRKGQFLALTNGPSAAEAPVSRAPSPPATQSEPDSAPVTDTVVGLCLYGRCPLMKQIFEEQEWVLAICTAKCQLVSHRACWRILLQAAADQPPRSEPTRCPTPDCWGSLIYDVVNTGSRERPMEVARHDYFVAPPRPPPPPPQPASADEPRRAVAPHSPTAVQHRFASAAVDAGPHPESVQHTLHHRPPAVLESTRTPSVDPESDSWPVFSGESDPFGYADSGDVPAYECFEWPETEDAGVVPTNVASIRDSFESFRLSDQLAEIADETDWTPVLLGASDGGSPGSPDSESDADESGTELLRSSGSASQPGGQASVSEETAIAPVAPPPVVAAPPPLPPALTNGTASVPLKAPLAVMRSYVAPPSSLLYLDQDSDWSDENYEDGMPDLPPPVHAPHMILDLSRSGPTEPYLPPSHPSKSGYALD